MSGRVEYGRQLDCLANGCDPFHSDHGQVSPWPTREFGVPGDTSTPIVLNGHAARWVTRVIPDWPALADPPHSGTPDAIADPLQSDETAPSA